MKNINQGEAEILLNECPNSVDSACEFAYAESQAWREKNSQLILEKFLEKYGDELNDVEKAKVYMNRPLNVRPKILTLRRSVFLWQNIALHLN